MKDKPEPTSDPHAAIQKALEALAKINALKPIGFCGAPDCWPCNMWTIAHECLESLSVLSGNAAVEHAGVAPSDWPEDFGHENGRYLTKCHICGQMFEGHKRRVTCKICSDPSVSTDEVGEWTVKERDNDAGDIEYRITQGRDAVTFWSDTIPLRYCLDVTDAHNSAIAKLREQIKALELKEASNTDVNSQRQIAVGSRYVVGFLFDSAFDKVALIRKNKPEWQAGLLNGIGGKIEQDECPVVAMRREFKEEAGRDIGHWKHFCSMSGTNNDGGGFVLECFWAKAGLGSLTSQESEQIEIVNVDEIGARTDTIGNLAWLVTLARDFGKGVFPPRIVKAEYGPSVSGGNDTGAALLTQENIELREQVKVMEAQIKELSEIRTNP